MIDWWVALLMVGIVALLVTVEHRRAERWRTLAVESLDDLQVVRAASVDTYDRQRKRNERLWAALVEIANRTEANAGACPCCDTVYGVACTALETQP